MGAPCWLSKHVDLHTMPSDVSLAININGPKWRNGDPPCGMDMPLDVVQTEFLWHSRVGGCGGNGLLHSSPTPAPLWDSWSDPDINAPKWACFKVMVALISSPFVIIPITLSIILDHTMTGTFLE